MSENTSPKLLYGDVPVMYACLFGHCKQNKNKQSLPDTSLVSAVFNCWNKVSSLVSLTVRLDLRLSMLNHLESTVV